MSSVKNEEATLEPIVEVPAKRLKTLTNWSKCLFCQSSTAEGLSKATSLGVEKVFSSFQERSHYETSDMMIRLKQDLISKTNFEKKHPTWHKGCYASFTSRLNIEKLQKRHERSVCKPDSMREKQSHSRKL